MKKITLLLVSLSFVMATSAQVDGFFPMFGQDAQWTVNEQFELVFSGAVAPAPVAAIATTFESLVSDGIGGNDFTGLNIKMDAIILDQATNTTFVLGSDAIWGGKGINLEFNQWLCQATTDFSYGAGKDKWMITTPSTYQAAVVKNGYNTIEINVNAAGLISCKLNGYVCDVPYQAPLASLKPTGTSTFFFVIANNFAGLKIKNMVVKKGDTTNTYFVDPAAGVKNTADKNLMMLSTSSKGNFTLQSNFVGKKYVITNTMGQQIQSGVIRSNEQNIDVSSANAGTYMLVVKGEKACKFVKN